jgi:hypothetical protein
MQNKWSVDYQKKKLKIKNFGDQDFKIHASWKVKKINIKFDPCTFNLF